jgi:hypothetical protein
MPQTAGTMSFATVTERHIGDAQARRCWLTVDGT